MRTVAVAFFVLASCSVALSQDAPTPFPYGGAPPVPRPLPAIPAPVASQPAARPVCPKPVPATPPTATTRLEHLLEAAVHLEAAGETQQAQQVRGLVARERRALLGQLDNEKCEVQTQRVLCHVRIIELSRSKLKKLGFDWTTIEGDKAASLSSEHLSAARFNVVEGGPAFLGMLEALRKDKLARFLAEPTLVGASGQPVNFRSGSELPVTTGGGLGGPAGRSFFIGTQVDLVPLVIESDRLRLELRVAVTEPVEANDTNSGQQPLPKVRTLRMNTGVEMKSGQTVVLSGWSRETAESDDETVEALILIMPEIVDAPLAAQANPPANAQR
jgi:type II/III secretion system protein